ncbi:hypothetical protein GCM10012284_09770 [Mangrovihabitans endophyticus]|uniref:CBM2 domain-containing protein n=1 Tax=Mangrovihabitans endophyticus TaxID=1751298 RepID=A0A8J3BU91_9ACTN|nr:hypothetical protein GCM10012284_09770 [Mangrovihabitans endophyticus]
MLGNIDWLLWKRSQVGAAEEMTVMRRIRWLTTTLALTCAAGFTTVATAARADTGCRADYAVTSQWQGGFGASVTVDNLGDPLNGWTLTWSFTAGQTVAQLWNGVVTQSGEQVAVRNAATTQASPPKAV